MKRPPLLFLNFHNQFKQSYKLRLMEWYVLEDSICPRVFSVCQHICITKINPYNVRTRSKYLGRTREPFSSPVNITKYQIKIELWLLSMWTTDADLRLTNQKLSCFMCIHTIPPLFAQGLLIAVSTCFVHSQDFSQCVNISGKIFSL
jgi:hypothetical protein